jgi:hypothetical protein
MTERAHESFRQAMLASLDTADEAELIEVLELIQVLLTRRRLRGPRPEASTASESDQEKWRPLPIPRGQDSGFADEPLARPTHQGFSTIREELLARGKKGGDS